MTIRMFDNVTTSALPAGPYAYAGYVDGRFNNYHDILVRFPGHDVLSIAVFASEDADCLDIENGDARPDQAVEWVTRQFARGIVPCLYASVSVMRVIVETLAVAGIPHDSLRLWSAHYTFRPHICGPHTCGEISVMMDATQWTDRSVNGCDESLVEDGFFGGARPDPMNTLSEAQMGEIMGRLPVLQKGSADQAGQVLFVHRCQQLTAGIGAWNGISATVGMKVDGVFGPQTEAAVKAVQKFFGLIQDGVVGPDTWSHLVTGS